MTLATHIVIAAAVTKPFAPHPLIGFLLGLISHYLSDAIPHWDYKLTGLADKETIDRKWDYKKLLKDLAPILTDFFLGVGVAYVWLQPRSVEDALYLLAIIAGSTLPDLLQGFYYTRKFEFLRPIQIFHDRMHTKIKLGPYPLVGIPFQLAIFFLCLYIIR